MKANMLKISLLMSLIFGLFITSASASTTYTNPSFQTINQMLTDAAIKYDVPPEVVKAVANQESTWKQFVDGNPNDKDYREDDPNISKDGGIGIMQITDKVNLNQDKLKNDIGYNIEEGVKILSDNYKRTDLPKIKGADRKVIENWYFPVMAYNGIKPMNSPLYQATGKRNPSAYQEKVFSNIKKDLIWGRALADYPFSVKDFTYSTNNNDNIKFNKLVYTMTKPITTSHSAFKLNNKVITNSNVILRKGPSTLYEPVSKLAIAKGTTLTINGSFKKDDKNAASKNQFVWYPVKMANGTKGYVSSAYLSKYVLTAGTVTNKSTTVSGHVEKGYQLSVNSGSKVLGTYKSTVAGNYKIKIPTQKAGTKLKVIAKNQAGGIYDIKDITVKDVIPPGMPSANSVSDKSTSVSGRAEAGSTVTIKAGKTSWPGKANTKGQYTIKIAKQKAGAKLAITAKDAASNISPTRSITVLDKTAPAAPKVNAITSKTTAVTGKAEANATITIKVKTKTLGSAKANSKGAFKVNIKAQKKGTTILVTAKDKANNLSKATQVKIVK